MLMGVVDSAMVGQIGAVPLAAVAFANNLLALPLVFGLGLVSCVAVRVSQRAGAGEESQIADVMRHALLLAFWASLALMGIVASASFFLDRFGQDAEVARQSRSFFLIVGASLLPLLISFCFKNLCEALGKPWIPTYVLLATVPLNVLLNWILIYGNLGAPALGIEGAAIATFLARLAGLFILGIWVYRVGELRAVMPQKWRAPLQMAQFASLLQIGVPAGLQVLLEVGAFSFGAIMVGWMGAEPLAAHQITLSLAATTFMLPLGLSVATSIRTAAAHGAQDMKLARQIGFNALGISLGFACLTALLFFFAGETLALQFVKPEDARVAQIAATLLIVTAMFQIVDGLQVVAAGALRGLSDATVPMICAFVAYWLVGLPLGYFLAFKNELGAVGIWSGLAVGLAFAAVVLVVRFGQKTGSQEQGERSKENVGSEKLEI